jgi:hypothetical protein
MGWSLVSTEAGTALMTKSWEALGHVALRVRDGEAQAGCEASQQEAEPRDDIRPVRAVRRRRKKAVAGAETVAPVSAPIAVPNRVPVQVSGAGAVQELAKIIRDFLKSRVRAPETVG